MDSFELEKRILMLVETAGFHLVSAHWSPMKGRQQLRVVADSEDHNITLGECAELSHAISDLLDCYPHEFPDYRLEVSSPGLKHPLEPWQFRKNLKRKVEVRYQSEGANEAFRGILQDYDGSGFSVQQGSDLRHFELNEIREVYVLPEW